MNKSVANKNVAKTVVKKAVAKKTVRREAHEENRAKKPFANPRNKAVTYSVTSFRSKASGGERADELLEQKSVGGVDKADELKKKVVDEKAGSCHEEALKKLKKRVSDTDYH